MLDESVIERFMISLGSRINVVAVGIGSNDTIVVSVNHNFTGTLPNSFEGYQVIKQVVGNVLPQKD
jgi:hypothetical protein